jgi:hypothetical protein
MAGNFMDSNKKLDVKLAIMHLNWNIPIGMAKYGAMLNRIGEMALPCGVNVHYHNHTHSVGETMTDVENLMREFLGI